LVDVVIKVIEVIKVKKVIEVKKVINVIEVIRGRLRHKVIENSHAWYRSTSTTFLTSITIITNYNIYCIYPKLKPYLCPSINKSINALILFK